MDEIRFVDLILISGALFYVWIIERGLRNEKKKTIQRVRNRGRARRAKKVSHAPSRHYHIQRRNNRKFYWTSSSI